MPVLAAGRPNGAVRVTQDMRAVADATRRATTGIGAVSGVVLLAGLLLAALLAGQIARPARRLQAAAQRLATGDLDARAPVEGAAEQQQVALAFNDMAVRLGRLLEAQRSFVADASHQLRTPLTGLRLRLEELRRADPQTAADDADAALAEVDRLSRTVDELLVLSQAGELDAPAEALELQEVLAETVDRWSARAQAQGSTLELDDAEGDPLVVRAAPGDVSRALDVLVENALLYGGRGVSVTLRASPGLVEVLDDGPGPAPGEEEAVFDRFHRGTVDVRVEPTPRVPGSACPSRVNWPGAGAATRTSYAAATRAAHGRLSRFRSMTRSAAPSPMRRSRSRSVLVGLGLLAAGLGFAVGMAVLTTRIASPKIGLRGTPSIGTLAPAARTTTTPRTATTKPPRTTAPPRSATGRSTPAPTQAPAPVPTVTAAPAPTVTPSVGDGDGDDTGRGRGRGRGDGDRDD